MSAPATVLVADPSDASRQATCAILREAGYQVLEAATGAQATERAAGADLVLLETALVDPDGHEVCRRIKQNARLEGGFLPVMFVAARGDVADRVLGLRTGGDDFLPVPYDATELLARVEALLRIRRLVAEAHKERADMEESAIHDRITGLYNQRYLVQRLEEEFRRAERYNEPLSLMAIDLDQFETVNSRFGRSVGDQLLADCARAIAQTCRPVDIVTRAGGDEFVVVLPNTHFSGSLLIAERLWRDVRATNVDGGSGRASCDASVGVACYPSKDVGTATELLKLAHAALGRAKAEGRGKICLYQHQGYLFQPSM